MSERMLKAIKYGISVHCTQKRKGTEVPYFSHLMAVTSIVLDYGGSEDEAIAAFLHDAVEDGGGMKTLEVISTEFGGEVADIVTGCTDAWTTPKPLWRQRKEAYIKHIPEASPSVVLVSIADKLANARSTLRDRQQIGDQVWERFNTGKEEQIWCYQSLVKAFRNTGLYSHLVDELEQIVAELEK